jgi:serine/threonine protein kinase
MPFRCIPPEFIQKSSINAKDLIYVDFWQIGIIMYILYYKKFPFGLKNVRDYMYLENKNINKYIQENYVLKSLDLMNVVSKKILLKLLNLNPYERINIDSMNINFKDKHILNIYFNDIKTLDII